MAFGEVLDRKITEGSPRCQRLEWPCPIAFLWMNAINKMELRYEEKRVVYARDLSILWYYHHDVYARA